MSMLLDATAGVDVATDAVAKATAVGAHEAQVVHVYNELFEVTYDDTEVTMVRSTVQDRVAITVFVDGSKGQSSLTGRSPDLVSQAVHEAVTAATAGAPDPANRVATGPSTELTELGHTEPDREEMIDTAIRHIALMAERYPKIKMRDSTYSFSNTWRSFASSAGRTHQERRAGYTGANVFSAKDGTRTTSFNYTSATSVQPYERLIDVATYESLVQATLRSFDPQPVPATFTGDVIFTPDSLATLIAPLAQALSGYALMRGTSPFAGSQGTAIADPSFTLTNRPRSPEFPLAASFDSDGVPSRDLPVVTKGVLDDFLVDWYTSNKLDRPMTAGVHHFEVAPGDRTFDELVAGTQRGIVLGRFSGGAPNQKLDFSGVAKNSFYVEDGVIRHPIAETMISGNFGDLLHSIRGIGSEAVNFGGRSFPALAAGGVTISRK